MINYIFKILSIALISLVFSCTRVSPHSYNLELSQRDFEHFVIANDSTLINKDDAFILFVNADTTQNNQGDKQRAILRQGFYLSNVFNQLFIKDNNSFIATDYTLDKVYELILQFSTCTASAKFCSTLSNAKLTFNQSILSLPEGSWHSSLPITGGLALSSSQHQKTKFAVIPIHRQWFDKNIFFNAHSAKNLIKLDSRLHSLMSKFYRVEKVVLLLKGDRYIIYGYILTNI